MSLMSNEAIQAQIAALKADEAVKIQVGDDVIDSSGSAVTDSIVYADSSGDFAVTGVTASKPVYIDSSSVPQTGDVPFSLPIDVSSTSTTASFLNVTGTSSLSGTADMTLTLVADSAATTFTGSGYIRVSVTDAGGNLVDGDHYIQIGTLS